MDKPKNMNFYDKEIGWIDIEPKTDPVEEKKRRDDMDRKVSEYYKEKFNLNHLPDDKEIAELCGDAKWNESE